MRYVVKGTMTDRYYTGHGWLTIEPRQLSSEVCWGVVWSTPVFDRAEKMAHDASGTVGAPEAISVTTVAREARMARERDEYQIPAVIAEGGEA